MEPWFPASLQDALMVNHNFNHGVAWRLASDGVRIDGAAPEDTGGRPATVARVLSTYGESILNWAGHYAVPVELVVATICTETRGRANALRTEPGYISDDETPHRVSCGLTQTLISTARECLDEDGALVDRDWLFEPDNAIRVGAAYIDRQRARTHLDPPKVACAYNSGGVYANNGAKNRWKMRQFPLGKGDHADRFIAWFNDCFRLFAAKGGAPDMSFYRALNSD
ncbi:MAG: transglycosylase SLT domain-containing protein [Alphaproteobacteria bacterium]|nr:transglycosylase SLT domain-containing protein [Alphaproteobacteria bacterium]